MVLNDHYCVMANGGGSCQKHPKEYTMESLLIAGGFVAVYLLLQIYILPKMGIPT